MEPRESRETDCFFCSSTLINVPSDHGNIKKYMEYVSMDIDEEWWNTSNFTFCRGCSQRLRTFSERLEKLEQARMEVNSFVQDICGVLLQSSQEGEGEDLNLSHVKKMIVEKSMALLEKARLSRNLPPALDGPFPVSSSEGGTRPHSQDSMASSSACGSGGDGRRRKQQAQAQRSNEAMTSLRRFGSGSEDGLSGKKTVDKEKADAVGVLRQRRTRRSPMPLPDFIVKIGRIEIRGTTQPLYHCGICRKDFPSCQLANHRRHGIRKEMAKTKAQTGKDLDLKDISPSQEKEEELMLAESENEEEETATFSSNLGALYACGNPSAFSTATTATGANSRPVIQCGPAGDPGAKLTGIKATASSTATSEDDDYSTPVIVSSPNGGLIANMDRERPRELFKEKASSPKLRKKFTRGKVTRRSHSVVAAELPDFMILKGTVTMYNKKRKLYFCKMCNKDVHGASLFNHKKMHGIGVDVCQACGKSFEYKREFLKHVALNDCGGSAS